MTLNRKPTEFRHQPILSSVTTKVRCLRLASLCRYDTVWIVWSKRPERPPRRIIVNCKIISVSKCILIVHILTCGLSGVRDSSSSRDDIHFMRSVESWSWSLTTGTSFSYQTFGVEADKKHLRALHNVFVWPGWVNPSHLWSNPVYNCFSQKDEYSIMLQPRRYLKGMIHTLFHLDQNLIWARCRVYLHPHLHKHANDTSSKRERAILQKKVDLEW